MKKTREALALLGSMIASGEDHSDVSRATVQAAKQEIANVEARTEAHAGLLAAAKAVVEAHDNINEELRSAGIVTCATEDCKECERLGALRAAVEAVDQERGA